MAKNKLPSSVKTHTISIARKVLVAGNYVYRDVHTGIKCNIQPASEQEDSQEGETLANTFYCYLDLERNILTNDRITDNLGRIFKTQGFEHHDYAPRYNHTKLKLTLAGA